MSVATRSGQNCAPNDDPSAGGKAGGNTAQAYAPQPIRPGRAPHARAWSATVVAAGTDLESAGPRRNPASGGRMAGSAPAPWGTPWGRDSAGGRLTLASSHVTLRCRHYTYASYLSYVLRTSLGPVGCYPPVWLHPPSEPSHRHKRVVARLISVTVHKSRTVTRSSVPSHASSGAGFRMRSPKRHTRSARGSP